MKKDIAMKWVKALRSGKYKQGQAGCLKTDKGYCCLGVLSELAVKARVIEKPQKNKSGIYIYGDEGLKLTEKVMEWAGLTSFNPYLPGTDITLACLNDGNGLKRRATFAELADVIEETYKEMSK